MSAFKEISKKTNPVSNAGKTTNAIRISIKILKIFYLNTVSPVKISPARRHSAIVTHKNICKYAEQISFIVIKSVVVISSLNQNWLTKCIYVFIVQKHHLHVTYASRLLVSKSRKNTNV